MTNLGGDHKRPRIPPYLQGKDGRTIERVLTARRVDRIIAAHLDRPEAARRANAMVAALTLHPRDPFAVKRQ